MLWAVGVVVVIGVGVPVIAWLGTRRLARQPPTPLEPYHGRAETWIHRQYGLDWPECSLIHTAVTRGRQVGEPGLRDAAHRLAAATLRYQVPGTRAVRSVSMVNLVLGPVMMVTGIAAIFFSANTFLPVYLIGEGVLFSFLGWRNYQRGVRRLRKNASRALELNQPAGS